MPAQQQASREEIVLGNQVRQIISVKTLVVGVFLEQIRMHARIILQINHVPGRVGVIVQEQRRAAVRTRLSQHV